MQDNKICEIPGCQKNENTIIHHLYPRNYRCNRRGVPYNGRQDKMILCIDCHRKLHKTFKNKELFNLYNTKEAIVAFFSQIK